MIARAHQIPAYRKRAQKFASKSELKFRRPLRERLTISGSINEAIDLLVENVEVTALKKGDLLALVNVGGYGLAASSNHCVRGAYRQLLLTS